MHILRLDKTNAGERYYETLAVNIAIYSHLHYSCIQFSATVISVTQSRSFVTPFLLLSPHSLPSALSKLLLKPTISN